MKTLPFAYCVLLYFRPAYWVRPYFEIVYYVPFAKKTNNVFGFPFLWRRLKIQFVACIWTVQLFDFNNSCFILFNNKILNKYVCEKLARKTSEVFACFCKVCRVSCWPFYFLNVKFEVCVRTNRILRNGYMQTAYGLTSPTPFIMRNGRSLHVHESTSMCLILYQIFKQVFPLFHLETFDNNNRHSCQLSTSHIRTGSWNQSAPAGIFVSNSHTHGIVLIFNLSITTFNHWDRYTRAVQ